MYLTKRSAHFLGVSGRGLNLLHSEPSAGLGQDPYKFQCVHGHDPGLPHTHLHRQALLLRMPQVLLLHSKATKVRNEEEGRG